MEYILVLAIVIISTAYAVNKLICLIKSKNNPCCDCSACALKEMTQQKGTKGGNLCSKCKKTHKSFGK